MPYGPGKGFYKVGTKLALSGGKAVTHIVLVYVYNNIISAGAGHAITLDKNGTAWGWGYNNKGQVGNNSTTSKRTPVAILGATKTFCKITGGQYLHTQSIDKNGQAWGWGYNYYGQIGNNDGGFGKSARTPVAVLGVTKTFCQIAAGDRHTIGIDKNGKVWSWGWNQFGELGNNSTTSKRTPVEILGTTKTFCQIAGGDFYTTSIDKNGKVWSWGGNGNGRLGDNTITQRNTPVTLLGATKTFCKIDAGKAHTIGLDKNGKAWGWGYNSSGRLGNNSTISEQTPVAVLGATKTFCSIACGDSHTIGLDKNGKAWGWGYNSSGRLGNNSTTSQLTPVAVLGATKTFCQISAGSNFTMAIDKNGKVWNWGSNSQGQLGINSTTAYCTPVMITTI